MEADRIAGENTIVNELRGFFDAHAYTYMHEATRSVNKDYRTYRSVLTSGFHATLIHVYLRLIGFYRNNCVLIV